jgi:predicted MFS family arabinose efflux permease
MQSWRSRSCGGAFAAFTYFRPFLETPAHATLAQLSLLLLALGVAGFPGTAAAGASIERHLHRMLGGVPAALGIVTLAMLLSIVATMVGAAALLAMAALLAGNGRALGRAPMRTSTTTGRALRARPGRAPDRPALNPCTRPERQTS